MARTPDGPEAAIERMVAEAEKTIGWSDENNTKRTKIHEWYNVKFGNPDPSKYAWDWCNGGITYWAFMSGNEAAVTFGAGYAYTVAHANAFRAKGQWTNGAAGIRRGDIVFFDWKKGAGIEHVGLALGDVVNGKVRTIEANTLNVVAHRDRDVSLVAGYGRPKYGGVSAPQPPKEDDGNVAYNPPAFPAGLAPNKAKPSARGLQAALKKAGYMASSIAAADNYGPATQSAVAYFHTLHQSLADGDYDPQIGPKGWDTLHREAYGGAAKPKIPAPAAPATTPSFNEPPANYTRVTYGGKTVNQRTKTLLDRARGAMGLSGQFRLTQGSYNKGVSASAGTHDGGGVVDIDHSGLNVNATLRALRQAGFAAWYRTSAEGFSPHIHACAIGDAQMASGARSQVNAYFRGLNGLANNRADSAPSSVGRPYPKWAERYR